MFIKSNRRYTRDGQQLADGSFLMVFSRGRELRALVRYVRMHQCGHFMMARVNVAGPGKVWNMGLSGTYGSDGLPMSCEDDLWDRLHPLPTELTEAFWNGGGHNSAGSEAMAMHTWAKENQAALRRLVPVSVIVVDPDACRHCGGFEDDNRHKPNQPLGYNEHVFESFASRGPRPGISFQKAVRNSDAPASSVESEKPE